MVVVRPSGIHGLGLFASRDIAEGEEIGRLEGRWVGEDGPHVLWVDGERGFQVENDLRFVNHDGEPNAAYFDDLTVGALRDIRAGEEITHNYSGDDDPAWSDEAGTPDTGEAVEAVVDVSAVSLVPAGA